MNSGSFVVVNADSATSSILADAASECIKTGTCYSRSADALNAIKQDGPPTIIILDLHMSDIDGWRFCGLIRSTEFEEMKDVPIILTSHIFPAKDLRDIAHSAGADHHLALPAAPDRIKALITEALIVGSRRTPTKALVVEDDKEAQHFLTVGLKKHGYEVTIAENSEDAVKLLAEMVPALVVMDHFLPNSEGFECLPAISNIAATARPVVITITGHTDPNLAVRYTEAGVDAFIRKPFSMEDLMALVRRANREHSLRAVENLLSSRTKELLETEQHFRDLYENAPIGYHTLDADGLILSMNNTELEWLGYDRDELVGKKTSFSLQTPASAERGRAAFDELKTSGFIRDIELDMIKKNGTILPVMLQSAAVRGPDGEIRMFRSTIQDITDRKHFEEQLRHSQKMESLGVIAVGVAHNFNNLLTPILANASSMAEDAEPDTEDHQALSEIVDMARRGARLVKQLTVLGRESDRTNGFVDCGEIVNATVDVLKNTFDPSIRFDARVADGIPPVPGNTDDIQQTLLNLCFNASDAMPGGGTVTIDAEAVELTEDTVSLSALAQPGRYAVISVCDTGTGIKRDLLEKIFDPFFTTKGLARGTGLGLSIAYNVLRDHGGFIHVYSEPDEGSKFRMYLPYPKRGSKSARSRIAPVKTQSEHAMQLSAATARSLPTDIAHLRGTERILVVDDESRILRSAGRLLRRAGYTVIEAADGISALDAVRKASTPGSHAAGIDLVILDVVMPHMTGDEVLAKLREITKTLPVVISSGYGNTDRIMKLLDNGAQMVVPKPFERAMLLGAIRTILDGCEPPVE